MVAAGLYLVLVASFLFVKLQHCESVLCFCTLDVGFFFFFLELGKGHEIFIVLI